ncbi:MAG: hypothetical protein FWG34_00475 [Oscillospiraceae bacterium]|jgi:hypothetical protein|nr:hypothetical protein [Oscillospiraceae bacterium]
MNEMNRNSFKNPSYTLAYIVTAVLLAIVFALCIILFGTVTYEASAIILNLMHAVAIVSALVVAFMLCLRCSREHAAKNLGISASAEKKPDFYDSEKNKEKKPDIYFTPRDAFYYMKRMIFFVFMIVLMNIAASFVGMAAVSIFGGFILRINNAFFQEFAFKLPMFALYLALVYKMLVRYGFMDSQKKIFNLNFKMFTFLIASMVMLPAAACDSFFCMPAANTLLLNIQTVFSPNVGVYIVEEDGFMTLNGSFGAGNVVLICLTLILTFAVQICFFRFAYNRGKKIFIKEHIRQLDEYEMDENI